MKNARYVAEFLAITKVKTFSTGFRRRRPQHDFTAPVHSPGRRFVRIHGGEAEGSGCSTTAGVKLAVSLAAPKRSWSIATMTHSTSRPSGRRNGITPAMVRISVGLEHPADIIATCQALDAI